MSSPEVTDLSFGKARSRRTPRILVGAVGDAIEALAIPAGAVVLIGTRQHALLNLMQDF